MDIIQSFILAFPTFPGISTPGIAKMVKWRVPGAGISTPGTAKTVKWRVPGAGSGTPRNRQNGEMEGAGRWERHPRNDWLFKMAYNPGNLQIVP